ncbi:MAG: ABC transporter substrate-binding protein [Solirubrobacterales bacterium]|nr:ABC transporter substrate-binding protein [Solirubrobacterales bacterium]
MTRALPVLAALCALALGACGGEGSGEATGAEGAAAGFPARIDQQLGEVTIEDRPTRVVALDYPSADAAIALGVVPVGMYDVTYLEGGVQEWTGVALDGEEPELIDTEGGFPFEAILRLRPDVILATNTYPLISESWDELNAIAPVVGHVDAPGVDTWQQGVRQVAKALGRGPRAERLIADVEASVARVREEHPEFAGKTVSFFNYVAGDGLYVIDDDSDASIEFLRDLGFAGLTDEVARLPGQQGRAQVSAERYPTIDADLILGTSPDPAELEDLERDTLFSRVPAVARGAYVGFGIGPSTAMAFPSVLSVPYAIDELASRLAEALTADAG